MKRRRKKIDPAIVRELYDKGRSVTQIASDNDWSKGGVSKALRRMGIEITRAVLPDAPKYVDAQDEATKNLLVIAAKLTGELAWIEKEIPPEATQEYRAWQDQKVKFSAEFRKLMSAIGDIGFKLFQAREVKEVLGDFVDEIGKESPETQRRIYERIKRRRDLRFPTP